MSTIDVVVWKIVGCSAIITVNALGIFLPMFYAEWFFLKNGISHFNCFIGGILFATASTQMLSESERPPSIDPDGPANGFPIVHFAFGVGFFLTLSSNWLIEGIKRHNHNVKALKQMQDTPDIEILPQAHTIELDLNDKPSDNIPQPNLITIALVFTFGGVLTGCAIGVEQNAGSVIVLSLSAAATDWIESVLFAMAISNSEKNKNNYKWRAVRYAALYMFVSVLSLVIPVALFSNISKIGDMGQISSAIMAVLAGCFIYITCIDILAKEIHGIKITGGYPGFKDLAIKLGQFLIGFAVVNLIVYFNN